VLNGFAINWTRDANNLFSIDTNSKGTDGVNSLHFSNPASDTHAFSAKIAVDAASTYVWSQSITATASGTTGEFGFYIDEYDAAGNWISGQWKGLINASFTGTKSITYIPSSTNVKQVGLQYYVLAGTTLDMYIDNVSLIKQ
jgi:hypothetical protein